MYGNVDFNYEKYQTVAEKESKNTPKLTLK